MTSREPNILRSARGAEDGFTVIPRRLSQDVKRCSGEALAVLQYVLSLPSDWEVRANHLRKEFRYGEGKMKRIFRELRLAGYMRVEKVRDPCTGAWAGSRVLVYDTPQSAIDDASCAPETDVTADLTRDADTHCCGEVKNEPLRGEVRNRPGRESTSLREKKKPYKTPPLYPPVSFDCELATPDGAALEMERAEDGWERFCKAWPFDPSENVERARRTFDRMCDVDRELAIRHAGDHVAAAKRDGRRVGQARRYLSRREFFARASGAKNPPKPQIFVQKWAGPNQVTDAWRAWEKQWRDDYSWPDSMHAPTTWASIDGVRVEGWFRPTLFPPPREPESSPTVRGTAV